MNGFPKSAAVPSPLDPWPAMRQIFALVCGSMAITIAAYCRSDIQFIHAGRFFLPFAVAFAAISALAAHIKIRLPDKEHLIVLLFMAFTFFATATNLLILQYCLATTKAVDFTHMIRATDHALGFDWIAFSSKVSALPHVSEVFGFCYQQWILEFIVVIVLLTLAKQNDEVFRLTFAYVISGTAMVLVSGFLDVKSIDAVAAYAMGTIHLPSGVDPYYLRLLTSLRSSGAHFVDLDHLGGIVSFPSCHAGAAVLLATAARNLKFLWFPFLCLNEFILVGTIAEGGHFLCDVLAGCSFAIAGLALYEIVSRKRAASLGMFPRSLAEIARLSASRRLDSA